MADEQARLTEAPPALTRNTISYIGWMLTVIATVLMLTLMILGLLFFGQRPYTEVVTYLVLPMFLVSGVGLILLGALREWRWRHKHLPHEYSPLPVINLNLKWQRRRVMFGAMLLSLFFGVSAFGVYKSYQFTESPVFCGLVCHKVMKPEYTTYQHSPHARVSCAECHIGEGADWYVKSKLSGMRQVWAVATNSYHLPISVPVHNLRPARETCEHCHWPSIFSGSMEKEIWHFAPDKTNTPMRYNLLMKVGGGSPEAGLGTGIHWHINSNVKVRYWARDEKRTDIPWVEVTVEGQSPEIYRSADCPEPLPKDAEIRLMDCVDCHNRPSHIYQSPRQLVNTSLASGKLDMSLPYLKRRAMSLFEQRYPDTPTALASIEKSMRREYAEFMKGPEGEKKALENVEWLQTLYQRNFFPEQNVDWREYPNHIGHFEFPGCNRCHDNKHKNAKGATITNECNQCHELVDQAEGAPALEEREFHRAEFIHPRNMPDIWRGHECTECHGSKG